MTGGITLLHKTNLELTVESPLALPGMHIEPVERIIIVKALIS